MRLGILLLIMCMSSIAMGQSCCSGGAPLSGNLGLPQTAANSFQVALSYDLNILNTLKSGSETLDDQSRKRITHTILLQGGYKLNDHLSFELLIPYVRQERRISPINLPSTFEYSNGMGDLVILSKYDFLKNYQVGIGLKFPTGNSTEVNSRGLTMNADMQPGSGSWDILYWGRFAFPFKSRKSMSITLSSTYRATGSNDTYFGNQDYEFGNETQIMLTLADQFTISTQLINPSFAAKFRHVGNDLNNDFEVPSTGGYWFFAKPGLMLLVNTALSIQSTVDIPVYADLTGTQLTPTIRWNISVLLNL